ncbi:MAG: hypothetical protein IT581_01540 [Verrucomicrobiales bacterium]|nr:hypothetical protein [Verrucomicrobiales bacterium]
MKKSAARPATSTNAVPPDRPRLILWIGFIGVVVLVLAVLMPRAQHKVATVVDPNDPAASGDGGSSGSAGGASGRERVRPAFGRDRISGGGDVAPERIVSDRVAEFTRSRRNLADSLARHFQVNMPVDVQKFFEVVEGGDWRQIKSLYATLSAQHESGAVTELAALWPAIKETYGVAEQATVWPAQELLAFGKTVLGSLQPGSVYIAGNEASQFVPALLGETGAGTRPLVLSAESLNDPAYAAYFSMTHPGRIDLPSASPVGAPANTANAGQETGAGGDGQDRISGGSVLRKLLEKNPGLSISVADPAAAKAIGMDVVPRGPILEVVPSGTAEATTAAHASETSKFWRETAERLPQDSLAPDSPARQAYAKQATAQAALLAERQLPAEAEQVYRAARDIAPGVFEPTEQLTKFLAASGRTAEAAQILDDYARQNEAQRVMVEDLKKSLQAGGRKP